MRPKQPKRTATTADRQEPAAVFAARFRAALAADDAQGHHRRLFCEPFGFDPREPAVVDALAIRAAAAVESACVSLEVDRAIRKAVACRLAEHWPLVEIEDGPPHGPVSTREELVRAQWMVDGILRMGVMEYVGEQGGAIPPRIVWPSSVSPDDVLAVVGRCKHRDAKVIAATMRAGQWYVAQEGDRRYRPGAIYPRDELYAPTNDTEASGLVRIADPDLDRALGTVFHPRLAALVAWAEKEVDAARRRAALVIDASPMFGYVIDAWDGVRTDKRGDAVMRAITAQERRDGFRVISDSTKRDDGFRVVVYERDERGSAQLLLPIETPDADAFVGAVRSIRGPMGLRHLSAFFLLLATKGARSGQLLWRVSDHMDAMQLGERRRGSTAERRECADEAARTARLVLEARRREEFVRQALLQPVTEFGRVEGGRRSIEGANLVPHPWIHDGIRNRKTGEIGNNWCPASPDLPSLNHVNHAPALLAGLRLPQRWRYAVRENGRTFVDLRGADALALFGIERDRDHHKGRAWDTFDANVDALVNLKTPGIGDVEWRGGRHTAEGMVRFHAARWMIERIALGVTPIEAPPPPDLRRGNDLRAWREARGLTQATVAAALKVSLRTVKGAEADGDRELPPKVRAAIAAGALSSTPAALPAGR